MKWLGILALIIVVLGGFYYFAPADEGATPDTNTNGSMKTYESEEYGISFEYPDTYTLRESNASKGGQEQYQIVLADTEALAQAPQNGEGPTSMTIEVFEKGGATSTEAWVRTTPQSNFQLSPNGALVPIQIGEVNGVSYSWDGLYRGSSIVFEHDGRIFMTSVTLLEATDKIVLDFGRLLQSIKLQ